MTAFRIGRTTPLPAGEAWRRLTDWPAHAARVPLTTISVLTPGPTRCGTRFVARTGVGRMAVDDLMEVVRWEPPVAGGPGLCRIEKRGRTVLGWAEITVREVSDGTRVTWAEELRVRWLPPAADGMLVRSGRRVFGRVVDGLLA
ncbi:SRPBCC family protein [Streptomyces sp. NPDC059176]|uniref:SRPBCC family protein n=1 Tax=unclassified Streptomyces TaxID=2593676 RepID=UPI0036CF18FA